MNVGGWLHTIQFHTRCNRIYTVRCTAAVVLQLLDRCVSPPQTTGTLSRLLAVSDTWDVAVLLE